MDHFANLKQSIKIWWNNKYLTLLYAAVTFFSLYISGISTAISSANTASRVGGSYNASYGFLSILIMPFSLLNLVLVLYFANVIMGGTIKTVKKLLAGEKSDYKATYQSGKAGWTKLLGLQLLMGLAVSIVLLPFICVIVMAVIMPFIGTAGASFSSADMISRLGFAWVLICCFSIFFFIFAAIVGTINTFAELAVVLEEKGVIESIKFAWNYVKKNVKEIVVATLVLILFALVYMLAYGVVFFVAKLVNMPAELLLKNSVPLGMMLLLFTNLIGAALQTLVTSSMSIVSLTYWVNFFLNNKTQNK
jgi:hypothetical protein